MHVVLMYALCCSIVQVGAQSATSAVVVDANASSNVSSSDAESSNSNPLVLALSEVVPDPIADALVVVALVGVAAAGAATPTVAPQLFRFITTLRCAYCDSQQLDGRTNMMETPLEVNVNDGGPNADFTGACIGSMVVLFAFLGLHFLLWARVRKGAASKEASRNAAFAARATPLAAAYLIPPIFGLSSRVLLVNDRDSIEIVVAVVSICVCSILLLCTLIVTLRVRKYVKLTVDSNGETTFTSIDSESMFVDMLGVLFCNARDPKLVSVRFAFVEEVASASLAAVIVQVRPPVATCTTTLLSLGALCCLHFCFVAFTRPFKQKVNNWFAVCAAMISGLSVLAATDAESSRYLALPTMFHLGLLTLHALIAVFKWKVVSSHTVDIGVAAGSEQQEGGSSIDDGPLLPAADLDGDGDGDCRSTREVFTTAAGVDARIRAWDVAPFRGQEEELSEFPPGASHGSCIPVDRGSDEETTRMGGDDAMRDDEDGFDVFRSRRAPSQQRRMGRGTIVVAPRRVAAAHQSTAVNVGPRGGAAVREEPSPVAQLMGFKSRTSVW